MSDDKRHAKGIVFIVIGFFISLFYYTVVIGGPVYAYGAVLVYSSSMVRWKKLLWIFLPAMLWWPVTYGLVVLAYEIAR